MLRTLILSASLILAPIGLSAQPTQEEIAAARLQYIDGAYEAALQVIIPAAEAGDANAQNILADAYDSGNGVGQDTAKAVEWWKKAAAQDFSKANHNLGLHYAETDPESARGYYERAAAQGNDGSMNNLGRLYEQGGLGEPDYEAAAEWFRKAADAGNTDAMNSLALLYIYADGVDEDVGHAYDLYREAAEAGDVLALKNLGSMYRNGYAVRPDPLAAMALYWMAADLGNAEAAIELAYVLVETDTALADPALGWAWCQIALQRAATDEQEEFEAECAHLSDQLDEATRAEGEAMAPQLMR